VNLAGYSCSKFFGALAGTAMFRPDVVALGEITIQCIKIQDSVNPTCTAVVHYYYLEEITKLLTRIPLPIGRSKDPFGSPKSVHQEQEASLSSPFRSWNRWHSSQITKLANGSFREMDGYALLQFDIMWHRMRRTLAPSWWVALRRRIFRLSIAP